MSTKRTMGQESVLMAMDRNNARARRGEYIVGVDMAAPDRKLVDGWEELKRQMGAAVAQTVGANPYQTGGGAQQANTGGLGQPVLAQDAFAKQAAAQGIVPRPRRSVRGGWGDALWSEFERELKKREAIVPLDIAGKLPPVPPVEFVDMSSPGEGAGADPGSGHGARIIRAADDFSSIARRMKELEAEKQTRLG